MHAVMSEEGSATLQIDGEPFYRMSAYRSLRPFGVPAAKKRTSAHLWRESESALTAYALVGANRLEVGPGIEGHEAAVPHNRVPEYGMCRVTLAMKSSASKCLASPLKWPFSGAFQDRLPSSRFHSR